MLQAANIIIADDHPLFRTAIKGILLTHMPDATIVEAEDLVSLQTCVEQNDKADLILLDLHMPGAEGFSSIIFLNAHYPNIPIIIISAHEESDIIRRAIDHGANGFLPKSSSADDIYQAIDEVLKGGIWIPAHVSEQQGAADEELTAADAIASLTPKQFRVGLMVSQGLLNKQIAFELNVTEATIKAHMTEIFRKLSVHSRTQVVMTFGQLAINSVNNLENFH
ncbi:MAG: response regulator transcription factor [Oleispira antarctica]|uniref:Putative two-component response regulator n=1 Tax=Oleispira antarctica RB-8 TaxID=698738 RepID=R4YUM8_OLEAN|nr:response regulator transcription factor [Oleispira antarctica]MBQ0792352.1 response regulator transcription factor [Oleispira antarctica]CCK77983.1 Putative two-component response regulator [Oleispira antarctica RB-8]